MIKSMTGFGRGEYNDGRRNIVAEIRSVNNRYSDINVRMPKRYSFAQDKVKNAVKENIKRGKVEVSILVENITEADMNISLDKLLARQYYDNLTKLKEEFGLGGDITLALLAGLPEVMKVQASVEDEEEVTEAILIPVREAAENLDAMRTEEGKKLSEDLIMRAGTIKTLTDKIGERADEVPKVYAKKLKERIVEITGENVVIPEDRILMEAAVFADKCNITEELTRLGSHVSQLTRIIAESRKPEGKRLDFLAQEMNREANTIGSKANDTEISNIVIEMKAEIEKIREQVQNIE